MKRQKAGLSFIFITILIDIIGVGIIIPVIPSLIMELTGEGISESAKYGGLLIFAYAIMQFLFSPIIGGLSDAYGRKPVIIASLIGLGLDYIVLVFAPTLSWLFLGRIISGIFGASITAATAYIADISPPEKRAANFGIIGAAFGLGFILGPVIGGILGDIGIRLPFQAAAGLSLINALYGIFLLPESLPSEKRRPFNFKRANPIGMIKQLTKYKKILVYIVVFFLLYFASHSLQACWTYYTMGKFNWSEKEVGYSLGAVGLLFGLVQGVFLRKIIPWLGEVKAVFVGLCFYTVGLFLYSIAWEGYLLYVFMLIHCWSGITIPALQGIASNEVSEDEQGELQGALNSIASLTAIFSPPVMTWIYANFSKPTAFPIQFHGAPYLLGSGLTLLCVVILVLFRSSKPNTTFK